MRLTLDIDGMPPEAIDRGIKAAQLVFDDAGVTMEQGAPGVLYREMWDTEGFPDDHPLYTDAAARAADVWDDAQVAALNACCPEWRERRLNGALMLVESVTH